MSHKSGADAGDLSHDEIRQVLSGVLLSDLPIFNAWHLENRRLVALHQNNYCNF